MSAAPHIKFRPAPGPICPARLPRWRLALAWSGLVLMAACQAQPPASVPAPKSAVKAATATTASEAQAALAAEGELLARIRSEIGSAACTSSSQCQTLAIGAKPCGGPESWLAWSSANAQADKLQAWASELAALQRERHERSGIASNCRYNPDPGALCREQRCVLAGGNPAS